MYTYEPYKKRVGQKYEVLVTEVAHDKNHYVGHNEFYEQVSHHHFYYLAQFRVAIGMKRQVWKFISGRVRQDDFWSVRFPFDWSTPVSSMLVKKSKD